MALSPAQWCLLQDLTDQRVCPSGSHSTKTFTTLEARGLIVWRGGGEDRVQCWQATPAGRICVRKVQRERADEARRLRRDNQL